MTLPNSAFASDAHLSSSELQRAEAEAAHHLANRLRAARVVAGIAVNADECRELLELLGLARADIEAALIEMRTESAGVASKSDRKRKSRRAA